MLLSQIVGTILTDLTAAQDAANEYSSKLGLKYKAYANHPNAISDFYVPNGVLKEIELNLNFVINDVTSEKGEIDLNNVTEFFKPFAHEAVQKSISKLTEFIDRTKTLAENPATWDTIMANLKSKDFIHYLTAQVTGSLLENRMRLISSEGTLKRDEFITVVSHLLDQFLLNNDDIKFALGTGTRANTLINNDFKQMVSTLHDEITTDSDTLQAATYSRLDILVSPEQLKDVPTDLISSIKIKAELTNYQWSISDISEYLHKVP
ncbi:MAG: hypothetical protein AB4058_12995 [Microcystaceae cyanobacterium]